MDRVFHIAFCCCLFVLLLSVPGREIPEISKFADDPSKDGQVARTEALWSPNLQRLDAVDDRAPFGDSQASFETHDLGPRSRGP